MKKFLTDIDVLGGEQIAENSVLHGTSSLTTIKYYERVYAAGGFIESIGCVANKIGDFGNVFANGSVYGKLSLFTGGFVSAPLVKTQSIQASGSFSIYVGSVQSVFINSSGFLGINKIDPSYNVDINGSFRSNGDTYVTTENGRIAGFTGLISGQTIHLQYGGDVNHRISTTYGSGVIMDAYHGLTLRTSPASTGSALVINNRNSSQYIQEWQVSGVNKAYIDGSGQFYLASLTLNGPVKSSSGVLVSVAGYTGSFVVPTNPPGMQTLVIQDGIITNVL